MHLDELKKTWQAYDQKLAATQLLNEKIIRTMIKDKSNSTLSTIRRNTVLTAIAMGSVCVFCMLAILYNAFDYTHLLQYLPLGATAIVSGLFSIRLVKEFKHAKNDLNQDNLAESLKRVLLQHEQFMASNRKLGLVILIAGLLWPLGNLSQIIEHRGLFPAIGILILTLGIQAIFLFIAKKVGAFKDHYGDQLREHLRELKEFEV